MGLYIILSDTLENGCSFVDLFTVPLCLIASQDPHCCVIMYLPFQKIQSLEGSTGFAHLRLLIHG